jgi:myosin-6
LKNVNYADNQDCIDLIEAKRTGLMDLLDEEMKLPKPSEMHFTTEAHKQNASHFRLVVPRKSHLSIHKSVRDDQGFLIRHFAGAVCYQTEGFLEKNNDALHDSLTCLLQESKDTFIKALFPPSPQTNQRQSKKLAFESVGKKFKVRLISYIDHLKLLLLS